MKKNFIIYTLIIFILTSFSIFAEREVDFEKLEYNEETKLVYVEGEKETFTGIAKYYSKDESSIFEFPYKNGKKEGRGKEYYLNGKFKSDAFFIDGLLQGKSIGYYENGNLEYEENYKDGKLDGLVKNYYENGQLKAELNYKNGKLDGLARAYHENGQLHIEENYKDGKLEGESTNYDENGNLTSKAIYKDDEMVENLFGDTEEDTSSKNNKLKGYTGPIIFCGLIGLYVFLTAYKMLKSFPKTSHLTFGYLFGYSKDHILASYSNATFKEVKKEIEDTVLHI